MQSPYSLDPDNMKHLLFLTTNNLATNPRLLKELQTALCNGFKSTVVVFKLGNWSDQKSEDLFQSLEEYNAERSKAITFIQLDATNTNKFNWLFWGILEKVAKKIYPLFKNSININALASNRRAFQLLKVCKQLKNKPDLICAHNLGALYPAFQLSKRWHIPFLFDVEDYHPGEYIRFDAENEQLRRKFLLQQLVSFATAITSASPLIEEYTLKLIGGHANHQVILNSFPKTEFQQPKIENKNSMDPLRLVWFSQKISFGRGLEQLFDALSLIITPSPLNITLTLIGDLDPAFERQIIKPFKSKLRHHSSITINHIPPLTQAALHTELAQHDIGLALEPGKDLNNELAVSNKIIAYAQAGLFILSTNTQAQQQFMEQNPRAGIICRQTSESISSTLVSIRQKIEDIRISHRERFNGNKKLAWEYEASKLRDIWMSI